MTRDQIKADARDFILHEFLPDEKPEDFSEDVKLISEGILDSMASLRLVTFLSEKFGVTIAPNEVDADHLDTLDLIADMVCDKLGTAS